MSPYPVDDLIGYLAGRWRVERDVEDRTAGAAGRFAGELLCEYDAPGALTMRERGELDWSGVRAPAYRTTRLLADGGAGRVVFEDGRPFHDLDLRSGGCAVTHGCAPDTYRGSFVVDGPDAWRYEWLVSGPRKDLRLRSRLTREAPYSR